MQYRHMPQIDRPLSALGFGCMRMPCLPDGSLDETRAIAQIRNAIDQGVNYLDTAWPYHGGQSEALVGKALADGYREKAMVATKLPSWMVKDRAHMDQFLDDQLAALGTDCIDFYLLHNLAGPMWERLLSMDVLDFLTRARAAGKIKYAGFSFHGHVDDFITIVDGYDWEFCQIQYNFLDQDFQAGTRGLEYAAAKKLGVVVMEPLRGGSLALPEPPPDVAQVWNRAETKRSPAEWGLRWVWDRPEVTVVLSGMNEEAHIEENLRIACEALPGSLTPRERELIDQAADTYRRLMQVGCTGCEYCLPCPMEVNIPGAFNCLNHLHLFKKEEEAKFLYAVRCGGIFNAGEEGYASRCIQCGECLAKCPQQIPIPEVLEQVVNELEDDRLYDRLAAGKKRLNME